MRKVLKLALISICVLIIPFLFLSCSDDNTASSNDNIFPIRKEIGNYIIDIEYSKMFQHSIITKYYVTTKDGSDIKKSDNIAINVEDMSNSVDCGISPLQIFSTNISNNRLVVFEEFFIVKNTKNFININYELTGSGITKVSDDEKKININCKLNQNDEDYKALNAHINLNKINMTIRGITNFEAGSLIHFYIYDLGKNNIENDISYILENYDIKLKSNNYINTYKIKQLMHFGELYLLDMDDLLLGEEYEKDIKNIAFFKSNLIYDSNNVNIADMQVYLVNKVTGEETLIYSN